MPRFDRGPVEGGDAPGLHKSRHLTLRHDGRPVRNVSIDGAETATRGPTEEDVVEAPDEEDWIAVAGCDVLEFPAAGRPYVTRALEVTPFVELD